MSAPFLTRGKLTSAMDTQRKNGNIRAAQFPQVLLSRIEEEINTDLALFGLTVTDFKYDGKTSEKHNCTAMESTPLTVQNAADSEPFSWEDRTIKIRYQDADDGFSASIDNLKDSIFKTTYTAAEQLLKDLLKQQGYKSADTREAKQLLEIRNKYDDLLNQLDTLSKASSDPESALFTVAISGGRKYQDILQDFKYELAQFLATQEQRSDEDVEKPIPAEMQHEWLLFLNQTEKDILSSRKRNPKVVAFVANPGGKEPIYKVETVWPLSDISSLDRRGYSPAAEQKIPNFFYCKDSFYDSKGNLLSSTEYYTGASPNVLEIKDKQKRFEATKTAIKNELQLFVFMNLRKTLMANPNISITELQRSCAEICDRHLGLQSTYLGEYKHVKESQKAYDDVMKEYAQDGMHLSTEFIGELQRITSRDLSKIQEVSITPRIVQDNCPTNAVRGYESKGLLKRPGEKPLQANIRTNANITLCIDFTHKFTDIVGKYNLDKNASIATINRLLQDLSNSDAKALPAKWDKVRKDFINQLNALEKNLSNDVELANQYQNLLLFAWHMDNNLKPQICPTTLKNFMARISDNKLNFMRQAITLMLDERMTAGLERVRTQWNEVSSSNCKSGKDRTGMVNIVKGALQTAFHEETISGAHLRFSDLIKYIENAHVFLPAHAKRTVRLQVCEDNCPGSTGFLAQDQMSKVNGGLVMPTKVVDECNLRVMNLLGRLNKDRWTNKNKRKIGENGRLVEEAIQEGKSINYIDLARGAVQEKRMKRQSTVVHDINAAIEGDGVDKSILLRLKTALAKGLSHSCLKD